jgi:ribosomal protein S18 acetylase RimI-like enzyme
LTTGIAPAADARDLADARALVLDYARSFESGHCFTGIEQELSTLPGAYAPPRGCLLLAREGGRATGCVAVRTFAGDVCELMRLYVVPAARGTGRGRALTLDALERARGMGYRSVRLDTLATMGAARALYRSLGFSEISSGGRAAPGPVIVMERALV